MARRARLVLLRHGQGMLGTDNYDRLSEAGQAQSELLGKRLASELEPGWQAWSGSLKRHRQTLQHLPVSAEAYIEPALNEYRVDALIRSAIDQAASLDLNAPPERALADPAAYLQTFLQWFPLVLERWQSGQLQDPDNGDWPAFRHRVLGSLARWNPPLANGRDVVVVSSAGVISTLLAELLNQDLDWQRHLNVSLYNASWTELVLDANGAWTLARVNCVGHLEERGLVTLA